MPTLTRAAANKLVDTQYRNNVYRTDRWSRRLIQFLYSQVAEGDIDESFLLILPRLDSVMIAAKRHIISYSWLYMAQKAAINGAPFAERELRTETNPTPRELKQTPGYNISPWMDRSKLANSGRPIKELNARAPIGVKALIKQGYTFEEARDTSMGRAASLSRTENGWTSRAVPASAVAKSDVKAFRRYRRVPAPGACPFCIALAARGAVYHSEMTAGGTGGPYHAHCRCTVSLEVDPGYKDLTEIDPDDMKRIRVRFSETKSRWDIDLGSDYAKYINRTHNRPPASEFVPSDLPARVSERRARRLDREAAALAAT